MRVTVPSSLSGGSLLDAHKWVKSKMARSNPGGTSDYKLADSIGNPMTLSDLVRANPATVEVEIISGRSGVRSNPSLPLPTDFTPSPDFARGGNFSNQLLPRDLDPALVERMVAQEGIFGAVNTLTILLSKRSTADEISPATAGLLYAYSAVPRKNPGGKTPFLADAPKEMHDSEIMIHRYLEAHGIDEVEKQSVKIGKAKISAKYDLTLARLEQFVKEVLAPFLAIASGNRGAIRTINKISAGFDSEEKKDFANNFGKLMYLMPTKAEDFYAGREYGLIATTEFIYPILAQKLLTPKDVDTLLGIAKKFPNNLDSTGKQLKLDKKGMKLIKNRVARIPSWKNILAQIPGMAYLAPSIAVQGDAAHAKAKLVKGKIPSDEQLISFIVASINLEMYRDAGLRKDPPSKFIFMRDIGGYYPSPPKGWPPVLMYSIMDAFLEALPEIVDIRTVGVGGAKPEYDSKVSMQILQGLTDKSTLVSDDYKEMKYKDFKAELPNAPGLKETFLTALGVDPTDASAASVDNEKFTEYIFTHWRPAESHTLNTSTELGKSVIELLYDTLEIARGKYQYEPSNDDITFILIMLDYSIKTLFDSGATATALTSTLTSIFGRTRTTDTQKRFEEFTDAISGGTITFAPHEADIAYLTGASALMTVYMEMAKAGNKKAAIKKAEAYKAKATGLITNPAIRNMTIKIVDNAVAEMTKM